MKYLRQSSGVGVIAFALIFLMGINILFDLFRVTLFWVVVTATTYAVFVLFFFKDVRDDAAYIKRHDKAREDMIRLQGIPSATTLSIFIFMVAVKFVANVTKWQKSPNHNTGIQFVNSFRDISHSVDSYLNNARIIAVMITVIALFWLINLVSSVHEFSSSRAEPAVVTSQPEIPKSETKPSNSTRKRPKGRASSPRHKRKKR
jgi:anaerobic C4-dicarboxylate transporter